MSARTAKSNRKASTDARPQSVNVERMLQINVAALVVLGTSLLAMGQQNPIYAVVAVVAAAVSIIVTDIKGFFRLGPDATTLAALFACCVLVVQVFRNVEQSQLLNVANILIYLEVILLFQRKEDRTYWSLIALSLLQVVVAAALNLGLIFGLFLGVYVLTAFCALTIFFVSRETRRFSDRPTTRDASLASGGGRGGYAFVGRISSDTPAQILNKALFRRLFRMIFLTALGTIGIFFAIPRFGTSAWQGARPDQVATVGFTEEVRLDDIGRILESPEQVMRVEFTDLQGRPYQVDGEPYFRGTVLSDYRREGVWKPHRSSQAIRALESVRSFDLANVVVQRITLQPGSHSVLFNVAPCYAIDGSPRELDLNLYTRQLTLNEENAKPRGQYRYTIGTTAFRNGWQRDLIPAAWGRISGEETFMQASITDELRRAHPAVVAAADRALDDQGLRQASVFERAKALENYFRRSGTYKYSLVINQNRDPRLDPIEDFVRNHQTGHCEYFAGALTLMLRSQGIPARMVVGFKGGEFNTMGDYYIVRQLHAHAWVEAFLEADEIPTDELEGLEVLRYGAWLRLDPTPGSSDVDLDMSGFGLVTTAREFADYCQVLWDDYILGLNSTRQQQAIYGPIGRSIQAVGRAVFSPTVWAQRWRTWRRWAVQPVFGIPGALFVALIAIPVGVAAYRSRHRLQGSLHRLAERGVWRKRSRQLPLAQLDAYRQLEQVLQRMGLRRRPEQTPLEFAELARRSLERAAQTAEWAQVPRRVAEAHYQIRFGRQSLSEEIQQRLSDSVEQLQQALAEPAAVAPQALPARDAPPS